MKKYPIFILSLISSLAVLLIPKVTLAFCPVCTVAVAAGLGLSRWLHIDDTVSGLWIGALLMSSTFWLVNWLKKKKINFKGLFTLALVVTYGVVVIPLWRSEIIGHPMNKIFGIDKLIFGIVIGTILFMLGLIINYVLKDINKGKQYFYFQKVVSPLVLLIIFSFFMYFITKRISYGL